MGGEGEAEGEVGGFATKVGAEEVTCGAFVDELVGIGIGIGIGAMGKVEGMELIIVGVVAFALGGGEGAMKVGGGNATEGARVGTTLEEEEEEEEEEVSVSAREEYD